jgi:hypothetical protein
VFAVGKQFPTLHRTLGLDPMYVVATTDCTFDGNHQACYVWWNGSVASALRAAGSCSASRTWSWVTRH